MKWLKKFLWVCTFFSLLHSGEITIAVAANVSYAIAPLKQAFKEKYPQSKVRVVLGSSGKLTAQITHGAPYDMLLSANMKYPEALYEKQLAVTKPVVYAQGTLALLSTDEHNYTQGLDILNAPTIHKIAIANPKTAPYGMAAKEALEQVKLYDRLRAKFVYGESISQTLLYTMRATDIGLVAKSLLFSPKMADYKEGKHWVEVDTKYYAPIEQGMVVLKRAEHNSEVKNFYEFMLSPEAKKILQSYGYRIK